MNAERYDESRRKLIKTANQYPGERGFSHHSCLDGVFSAFIVRLPFLFGTQVILNTMAPFTAAV
ncbi:MAG: hypothetical protein JWO38_2489 [Gemmataceae bacterium]|nr:hypothetical protein [Gemmataceae bacterium]